MPINHFKDRHEDTKIPSRIQQGDIVLIVTKEKQGTKNIEDLIEGVVFQVLSKGTYYNNGAKVLLCSGEIGRCQYFVKRIND